MGQHHWQDLAEDDRDPPDDEHDRELLTAVTGLGEVREPDDEACAAAEALLPGEQPDLRGDEDRP